MPGFDAYVMVDWSAAAKPTRGRDSIWYAAHVRDGGRLRRIALENPPTRALATAQLADLLAGLADEGRRVLCGFDFPFGYPAGTAAALGHDGLLWRRMWAELDALIEDRDDNANNRFEVGDELNRRLSGAAHPFWGCPNGRTWPYLKPRKPAAPASWPLAERRLCDRRVPRAQPVWKLAYTGSVGSQALTGIPRIWQLRTDPRLAFRTRIWPFETGLADRPDAALVLAEVYPSLVDPAPLRGLPKDAGQVVAMSKQMARWDAEDRLPVLFACDPGLSSEERAAVEMEEAWILGVAERPVTTPSRGRAA